MTTTVVTSPSQPLFADGRHNGRPAKIGRVCRVQPARNGMRDERDPFFEIRVKAGSMLEVLKFTTEEAANAAYSRMTFVPSEQPYDADEQDRAVETIMLGHVNARIDREADGSLTVVADGAHRYYVSPDGDDFYCTASEED